MRLAGVQIPDPLRSPELPRYVETLWKLRQRHGMLAHDAERALHSRTMFAALALQEGTIDGVVAGLAKHYADAVRPFLQVVRTRPGVQRASGCYIVVFKREMKLLADTTVIPDPTAEELAGIAIHTAELARYFALEPDGSFQIDIALFEASKPAF